LAKRVGLIEEVIRSSEEVGAGVEGVGGWWSGDGLGAEGARERADWEGDKEDLKEK